MMSRELGLKRGLVEVVPYDSSWADEASRTIGLLKSVLGDAAADMQHIGSTAVRGISAKPIIDIAVGVNDFDDVLALNDDLEKAGFIFRGQDLPDQYLYVCGGDDYRTHHIHVVIYGSVYWKNYINMRDYLNAHEEDARAYSNLKQKLALQYPDDRIAYTNAKSAFIDEILRKASGS